LADPSNDGDEVRNKLRDLIPHDDAAADNNDDDDDDDDAVRDNKNFISLLLWLFLRL
jgi:hypothetical protein